MELAYREYGQGAPLIILHGLFGQSDNWNTLAKNFAANGLHVFAIDQRNHGSSPHSDEWNYEVMADDLEEFIKQHHLIDPVLLGHSMGGKTVLMFEKKYPGLASKIIIADMSARAYPPHHEGIIDTLRAVDFSKISTRKEAEEALDEQIKDFGTKQFLLKNIYWRDDKKMAWRFNLDVISAKYDTVTAQIPFFKSSTPTLIMAGEKSNYILESDREDFRERFSDVRFNTIANAGHWLHAEKPKEFQQAVLNFIKA